MPLGELTLHGSISGQSFTRTITKDTTEVYVMPEGSLYWYGNTCDWITGGYNKTQLPDSLYAIAGITTKNKIDFSKFNKLVGKYAANSNETNKAYWYHADSTPYNSSNQSVVTYTLTDNNYSEFTIQRKESDYFYFGTTVGQAKPMSMTAMLELRTNSLYTYTGLSIDYREMTISEVYLE